MATRYEKLEEVYQHAFVSNKVRSSHNKSPTRIVLDVSGQHTLRWAAVEMRLLDGALQPVHSKECNLSLPAGECNLYTNATALEADTTGFSYYSSSQEGSPNGSAERARSGP